MVADVQQQAEPMPVAPAPTGHRCHRCGMAIWPAGDTWYAVSAGWVKWRCGWHSSHRA